MLGIVSPAGCKKIKFMRNFDNHRLSIEDQKIIQNYFNLIERLKSGSDNIGIILMAVIDTYEVTQQQLMAKNRAEEITRPRHAFYYLLNEYTPLSLSKIGNSLGLRQHHTTVLSAIKKVKAYESNAVLHWGKIQECISKIKKS